MDPRDRFSLGNARGGSDPALRRPKLSHAETVRRRHLMQEQMRTRPPTFDIKKCMPAITCEMWQAKSALHDAGLLDKVDAAIKAADRKLQIEWEYSTKASSAGSLANFIAQAIGWDKTQLDKWLAGAASIKISAS